MRSLALASILALAPVAALAASLGVPLNQSVLVSLPGPAHNVFLGNPAVADVTMSDQRHAVVTGKAGGVTNLIITDDRGRTIFDRQIVVSAGSGDRVSLINGGNVISYACAPSCEQVGDAQLLELGKMVAEAAGLRRAAARTGDVVPSRRRVDPGHAGARINIKDGAAEKPRQIDVTTARRRQGHVRQPHAGEMPRGAVVLRHWNIRRKKGRIMRARRFSHLCAPIVDFAIMRKK